MPAGAGRGTREFWDRQRRRRSSRHRRRREVRALLRAVPQSRAAARAPPPQRRASCWSQRPPRPGAAFYEERVGHLAMAAAVPAVLLARGDGQARTGSGVLPLRRRRRRGAILERTRHALTELDPADNPYVHWILTGTHGDALPCALRPEHFDAIRANLDRLEWHCVSVEEFLERSRRGARSIATTSATSSSTCRSSTTTHARGDRRPQPTGGASRLLEHAGAAAAPECIGGAPAAARRSRRALHQRDRAFFYSALRVEEVQ